MSTRSCRPQTSSSQTIHNSEVQGINLEILEQLRSLREEIHNDRFKKEQNQYIKQIVNKELNKSWIRSKYAPDLIPVCDADIMKQQENELQEAPVPHEPQQEIRKFRSAQQSLFKSRI